MASFRELIPHITDEQLEECSEYLDELKESGVTNMFGATPYLVNQFGFSKIDARLVLAKWMADYEK